MKDLRDLQDLTIHDVQPIRRRGEELHEGDARCIRAARSITSQLWLSAFGQLCLSVCGAVWHFEPSLDALSLRSDVISSINILSPVAGRGAGSSGVRRGRRGEEEGPRDSKLPWREAGPPNHHDDTVDSDQ